MSSNDINVVSDNPASSTTQDIANLRNAQPTVFFNRAVVVEVIHDPSLLSVEDIQKIVKMLQTPTNTSDKASDKAESKEDSSDSGILFPELLKTAPRNSLIVKLISMARGASSPSLTMCYPFFSPHISVPVKPGEQVWVIFESPDMKSKHGWWLSRLSGEDHIDDINYTHLDRKFISSEKISTAEKADRSNAENTNQAVPTFPNGTTDGKAPTMSTSGKDNPFDLIVKNSSANNAFVMEPVPRLTKRPGDCVLQGSNNTAIILGQDRGWTKKIRPLDSAVSNASIVPKPFSGTIDIVAGRGRFLKNPDTFFDSFSGAEPRVTKNSRNLLEVDKNPTANTADPRRAKIKENRLDRPAEGDPDFDQDASRIYISMKTNGDENFATDDMTPSFMKSSSPPVTEKPFIVVKSNEIRIISRHTPKSANVDEEENGSIRIIREGKDGKVCSVVMTSDGKVMIDAEKIVIGDGRKEQIFLGSEASQSAVLGDRLVEILTDFCTRAGISRDGFSSPVVDLQAACISLKQSLESIKSQVTKVK